MVPSISTVTSISPLMKYAQAFLAASRSNASAEGSDFSHPAMLSSAMRTVKKKNRLLSLARFTSFSTCRDGIAADFCIRTDPLISNRVFGHEIEDLGGQASFARSPLREDLGYPLNRTPGSRRGGITEKPDSGHDGNEQACCRYNWSPDSDQAAG